MVTKSKTAIPYAAKSPRFYPSYSVGMKIETLSGARLLLYNKYDDNLWKPTTRQCSAVRMFMKRELGKQGRKKSSG